MNRRRHGLLPKQTGFRAFVLVALGLAWCAAEAGAELWVHEPFDYERRQGHVSAANPGEGIAGLEGGIGFSGPWFSIGNFHAGIPEGEGDYGDGETWGISLGARLAPLAYTDAFGNALAVSGNQVRTAFGNHSWDRRNLAQPVGELGGTLWMSFLAQAHGDSTATSRYAFVELSNGGGNRAWFGNVVPVVSGNWAMQLPDHPGGALVADAGDSFKMSAPAIYVVKFEFPPHETGSTRISVWLNPASLADENDLPLPLFSFETSYSPYDQIGVAGRYSTDFDEIRLGGSFDAVTPITGIPRLAPALDFQREGENLVFTWPVIDGRPFLLYVSDDLQNWSPGPPPEGSGEGFARVSVPMTGDRRFFRLQSVPLARPRLAALERSGWEPRYVREGVVYYERHLQNLFGDPQVINVLAVDLDHPEVRIELTATDVWGLTRVPIPELAEYAGALAAINGGFAPARVHPEVGYGIMKFRGAVWPFVNDPDFHPSYEALGRNAVGIDAAGEWHVASRGEQGWEVGATWDDDWPGMVDAMAGGSHLVRNGDVHPLVVLETTQGAYLSESVLYNLTFNRHPRTALGVTDDRIAVLVTIAGRFPGIAAGMTLREVAEFLVFSGCRDALEMDGGGSTTMWIRDEPFGGVVNYPTDNGEFDHEGARSLRLGVLVMEVE